MTHEAMTRLAQQWISLWCAPVDWVLFDRLHADDFEDYSSAGRGVTKKHFRDGLEQFVAAFPDIRTQVDELVIDEAARRMAIRWSAIGTNRGAFLGMEPSNRPIPMTGIEIIEVRDGRIVKRWGEWDLSAHLARA